jgi:hypothetical protein
VRVRVRVRVRVSLAMPRPVLIPHRISSVGFDSATVVQIDLNSTDSMKIKKDFSV